MVLIMYNIKWRNFRLVIKTLIIVLIVLLIKYICYYYDFELMGFNTLFSAIIAANVFLLSFLLNGVMVDYKESEKIPGEIAAIMTGIYDEFHSAEIEKGIILTQKLSLFLESWFYYHKSIDDIITTISEFYPLFVKLDNKMNSSYILRLKNELGIIKKLILRAETIRDTNFISSGYLIAIITTTLMCLGLIFADMGYVIDSLFITGVLSFLMIFLINLIYDLDNPFAYDEKHSAENISLHTLHTLNQIIGK